MCGISSYSGTAARLHTAVYSISFIQVLSEESICEVSLLPLTAGNGIKENYLVICGKAKFDLTRGGCIGTCRPDNGLSYSHAWPSYDVALGRLAWCR